MTSSTTRTPISGNCICRSEKSWKVLWHRRYRHAVRRAIRASIDPLPHYREHSNVWVFGKDGKTFWTSDRFDIDDQLWKLFGK